MNFVAPDFMPVLPEIFVLTLTCLILVIDVFLEQRQRHITYGLAQFTLLGAALLTLLTYSQAPVTTMFGHYIKDAMGDLLKLFIYGSLNRIPSSPRPEREAGRNVELMWLIGRLVPDHKTTTEFRRTNGGAIRKTCAQFVELCRRIGELKGD